MVRPDHVFSSMLDVRADWLSARGIDTLIIDVDNTLVPYGEQQSDPGMRAHIGALTGAGIKSVLLSNARPARAAAIAAQFDLPYIAGAGKPSRASFRRALALAGRSAATTAVVGDQLFRDVLGAKLSGCLALWVRPLSPRDFPGTKLLRGPERLLERYLRRRGRWPIRANP